ncbi:type II toxin-antitoxin system RelE/ParE family toxin [Flavobacterium sp.]
MNIIFSLVAQEQYKEIIFDFYRYQGEQKSIKFQEEFQKRLIQLKKFPFSFGGLYQTDKRKFVVCFKVNVVYKVKEQEGVIQIIAISNNFEDPRNLLLHL